MQIFRAKASWMKACGYPEVETDFKILRKTWTSGGLCICCVVEKNNREWTLIAPWRGEIIEVPESE